MLKSLIVLVLVGLMLSGCGVAALTIATGYTVSAIGQKNTDQRRAYTDYLVKTEQLNLERHKAGLEPLPIKSFDEWRH